MRRSRSTSRGRLGLDLVLLRSAPEAVLRAIVYPLGEAKLPLLSYAKKGLPVQGLAVRASALSRGRWCFAPFGRFAGLLWYSTSRVRDVPSSVAGAILIDISPANSKRIARAGVARGAHNAVDSAFSAAILISRAITRGGSGNSITPAPREAGTLTMAFAACFNDAFCVSSRSTGRPSPRCWGPGVRDFTGNPSFASPMGMLIAEMRILTSFGGF